MLWNPFLSSPVSKWMGHTTATIFLQRGYCQTYSGYPRVGFCLSTGHCTGARDTVAFLERKVPDFISPELWPPSSPNLNPVDYSIWSVQRTWYAFDQREGTLCPVDRGCCYRLLAHRLSACVREAGNTLSTKHKVSAILSFIYQKLLN